MKKTLLTAGMLCIVGLLTACGNKTQAPADTDQENLLPIENQITMECPTVIQNYLDNADTVGEGDTTVQAGDTITVDYIGRLADGTVFDTSVTEVALACGTAPHDGLTFPAGLGQMIAGFDEAVIGMKVNQTKTVTLSPDLAYGYPNPEYIQVVSVDEMPNAEEFEVGMKVYLPTGASGIVTKKTDKEMTLDFNNELAGKELIFDITVKNIN